MFVLNICKTYLFVPTKLTFLSLFIFSSVMPLSQAIKESPPSSPDSKHKVKKLGTTKDEKDKLLVNILFSLILIKVTFKVYFSYVYTNKKRNLETLMIF